MFISSHQDSNIMAKNLKTSSISIMALLHMETLTANLWITYYDSNTIDKELGNRINSNETSPFRSAYY